MPFYDYHCEKCGKDYSFYSTIDGRDNFRHCAGGAEPCGGQLHRLAFQPKSVPSNPGYWTPRVSDALGINPDQLQQALKVHPGAEFTPDGAMVIHSHEEFKRRLKESGMVDRNK
jgi:hypothetical protein